MTKATFDKLIPLIQAQFQKENRPKYGPFFLQLIEEEDFITLAADQLYEHKILNDKTYETKADKLGQEFFNEALKRGVVKKIIAGRYGDLFLVRKVNENEQAFEKRSQRMLKQAERLNKDIRFATTSIFSQVRFLAGNVEIRSRQVEEHAKMWGIKSFSAKDIINELEAMGIIKLNTTNFPGQGPRTFIFQKDNNESEEDFAKRIEKENAHDLKVSKKRLVTKLTGVSPEKNHLRNLKALANSLPEGPERIQAFREYSAYKRNVVKKLVKDVYRFVENSEVQSF